MAQRRFGPTRGAGVVVIEKSGQQTITPGALGTTAFTGIMQKGPVGKMFFVNNVTDYGFRAGGIIPESLLPDSAIDRLRLGNGAGQLWLNRLTDGDEKTSFVELTNRKSPTRALAMKIEGGNPGRWGGKKQILIDEYDTVLTTTLQLDVVPADLKVDELVGALVSFNAIPGKSFVVVSNTALGLLTFPSDVDLVAELGGSLDKLISVNLANDGEAIAVKVGPGTDNPSEEFKMEVFFIEGNISTLVKTFDNLSPDPAAGNYYIKVVNDDSDVDFNIRVEDLQVGVTVTADIRPANLAGESLSLTSTVLTLKISQEVPNSPTGAKAKVSTQVPGASIIDDDATLTVTATGARATSLLTFPGQPTDGDTVVIAGETLTFKTVPTLADEVLIGATAADSRDNLVAKINSKRDTLGDALYLLVFAEATGANMDLFAATPGVLGNALTTTSAGGTPPTFAGATLSGGVDQTWTYASAKMTFITGVVVTSGVALAPPNAFAMGFTLVDTTFDSTKEWQVGESLLIEVRPLANDALVGGTLRPKSSLFREGFEIVSNDSESITVKTGSDMTVNAVAGDQFDSSYEQQLGGGSDGVASIADINYLVAYDTGTSPLKAMRGKNLGLIKLASPGVNSAAVQKAGVAFGASQNWMYRYEIPANIVSEQAAEEYINETIGRNDFAVVSFPSYGFVPNPLGEGLKLVTLTGSIMGVESRFARDFDGYHKAAAGVDAILSNVIKLPAGLEDKQLDEEFLNPQGIGVIKQISGNFVLWGDRTLHLDPSSRFKHKRETLSHYENIFLENFDFIIFALNNRETREQLKSTFLVFFIPEFAKGAIVGDSVTDAAIIKIDDENNPASETNAGNLNASITLNLVDTVERFIITVSQLGVTEG